MKILVPTDFGLCANHAIQYASILARKIDAELILLHVYTPAVSRYSIAYPLVTELTADEKREAQERLSKQCVEITKSHGVLCSSSVMIGGTVEEILRGSQNVNADMIVMGTHGATGLDRILFGSNTASVLEKANCPVLAVPQHTKLGVPKRIAFATNYQDKDKEVLKAISKLVVKLKAELLILHVSKRESRTERDMIEHLSKTVALDTGLAQPLYYVLPNDDVQKGVELFIDSAEADLIALSTRNRTTFEKIFDPSLTKKMAFHSRVPLLAFHSLTLTERSDTVLIKEIQ